MNRQILKKLQILTKKLQRLTKNPARVLYEFFRNYTHDELTPPPAIIITKGDIGVERQLQLLVLRGLQGPIGP